MSDCSKMFIKLGGKKTDFMQDQNTKRIIEKICLKAYKWKPSNNRKDEQDINFIETVILSILRIWFLK